MQRTGRQASGRYIPLCFFAGAVRAYHRALVEEIAARFDLPFTLRQDIPAHFTVKYHFETTDIAPVEALLDAFARAQHPAPVEVGGFGHFDEDVAWVNVALSGAAEPHWRPCTMRCGACPGSRGGRMTVSTSART